MFRNGDNQQGVCPLEFLQEVWHQAYYPLHYWRNVKPSENKRKPFHEHNINKHICSAARCINNILREQNTRNDETISTFASINEEKDRFIITYKNPIYVKNITTCNSNGRKGDRRSSRIKENIPSNTKICRKKSNEITKNVRKCSYTSDISNNEGNNFNCSRKESLKSTNENKSVATQTYNVNDINDLVMYTRLNYKNITEKICDKYYYAKTRNTVLWYINDNLIQIKKQNSLNLDSNNNYNKMNIPISSSFRPLDIARISNYLYSNKNNNFHCGRNLPSQFRLYTSVSRPLTIRQF